MKDIEKAIKNINYFIEVWELEQADEYTEMIISKDDIEAFNLAISTLEKQIPKKPLEQRYVNYEIENELIGLCPSCGLKWDVAFWQRYCSNCGQKFDWSVEE